MDSTQPKKATGTVEIIQDKRGNTREGRRETPQRITVAIYHTAAELLRFSKNLVDNMALSRLAQLVTRGGSLKGTPNFRTFKNSVRPNLEDDELENAIKARIWAAAFTFFTKKNYQNWLKKKFKNNEAATIWFSENREMFMNLTIPGEEEWRNMQALRMNDKQERARKAKIVHMMSRPNSQEPIAEDTQKGILMEDTEKDTDEITEQDRSRLAFLFVDDTHKN